MTQSEQEQPNPTSTPKTETPVEPLTLGTRIQRIFAGAGAGFVVSVVFLAIYRWIWHIELPLEKLIFSSLTFSIYCGALSTLLGPKFWKILGDFIASLSV